jgi:hypothetical protein
VILDFDGVRAELCHWKLDEVSISWNTIDTTAVITGWDWFELTPQWSSADERLEPFIGQVLQEVALLEWRPSGQDLAFGNVAVEFVFDAGRFRIANENAIDVGDPPLEYAPHRLDR